MAYQVTRELEQLRKAFSQLLNTYISIVTVATMTNDITDEVHFVAAHAQQTVDKVWTTSRWSASSTCLPPFVHLSDLDHDLSTDNIWHTLLDLLPTPRCPFSPEPPRISKNLLIPQNGGRFAERFRKSLLPDFSFLKCWMFILITTYVGFST